MTAQVKSKGHRTKDKDYRILHGFGQTIALEQDGINARVYVVNDDGTIETLYRGKLTKEATDWYMHPFAMGYQCVRSLANERG